MTTITIPNFNFSGFYYPELLEELMRYKRIYVPELTEELEEEPFIQFFRAVALVGHLNNCLLDVVANESTLPTAKLADTVREMLKLIGYTMAPATPAQTDIVYKLSKVFSASFNIISQYSQVATKRDGDNPVIIFEAMDGLTIDRTDLFGYVFGYESGVFVDYTADANSPTTPADDWTPWATPAMGDCIYWGHAQVMWDKISTYLTSPSENIEGVFEFYDGQWRKVAPASITNVGGGYLQVDLTTLLGDQNRQGTLVKVSLNESSAYQDVYSTWNGVKNICTIGYLGQSSPSLVAADYSIGSDWSIIDDVEDGTVNFTQDGDIDYSLPQTITKNWIKCPINGYNAYWIRYRIINVSTPTSPVIINTRMDEGKQYALRQVTQGQGYIDTPFSSTGLPNQRFDASKENFIINSDSVEVESENWTKVVDFLASKSTDKHYMVQLTTNDRAVFVFGDGVNGKIPPIGVGNIIADYRHGANYDGNVGSNTITVDKTGLTYVDRIWNPRQATGWGEAQGASAASLEKAKIAGPASLRTRDVALNPSDVANLTLGFTDEFGAKPFGRAFAIEEGYGPKTIELVVVAKGGGYATSEQLAAIELYFNGDKYAHPPIESHLAGNNRVIATNYSQKTIDLNLTIYGDISEDSLISALSQKFQPEALKEDKITWMWNFGDEIPLSRINHEIFTGAVTKVIINSPTLDINLQPRELPILGTVLSTIIRP